MKIKQKIINNKYKNFLKGNTTQYDYFQNKYMITEYNSSNDTLNKIHRNGKSLINFKINNNLDTKYDHFQKTLSKPNSEDLDNTNKIKIKLKSIKNRRNHNNNNSYITRYILPFINSSSYNTKNSNLNSNNKYIDNNKLKSYYTNLTKVDNYIIKDIKSINNKPIIFPKNNYENNEIEEVNGNINSKTEISTIRKRNEINDENKFKYSLILKNLDIWDKDHCEEYFKKSDSNIFNYLNNYYIDNNLIEDKNNLFFCSNILKTRRSFNNLVEEGKQNNKIFVEMIKMKRKENGTILKNNLYKAKLKFSELFNKKYSKEFDENLDIDPDTLNLLIEDELKNVFYNQVIKERIKYENQLHDDLLKINNIIFNKKNIKDEKMFKLKNLYIEKNKLKKEYNEKYNKNRKTFWSIYDNYEHHYKKLITKSNIEIKNNTEENDDNDNDNDNDNINNNKINKQFMRHKSVFIPDDKKYSKSPSPSKKLRRRLSNLENQKKEHLKMKIKQIEDEKKFKILHMNNEMNSKLKIIHNNYISRIDKIDSEQKKLEDEVKIIKIELDYYKKINDELIREHKFYYMEKLKKGYDCRKEGLMWVVANLLELQIPLEYHHFPKYLTHEQIDYLKKYANLLLKQKELKIIINVLKKKQNTQKMKNVLKCMDVIDNIIDSDHKNMNNIEENNENGSNSNKDFIIAKNKINKKFMKIYQENIDTMKNYLSKNVENYEFHHVINELKKDLYHGSNSAINKSKENILNIFMGDNKNKNFFQFLVDIKSNYQSLEEEKYKLFINQKQNFLKLVESSQNHKASISTVVKNEMIKRCLFGTRLER